MRGGRHGAATVHLRCGQLPATNPGPQLLIAALQQLGHSLSRTSLPNPLQLGWILLDSRQEVRPVRRWLRKVRIRNHLCRVVSPSGCCCLLSYWPRVT